MDVFQFIFGQAESHRTAVLYEDTSLTYGEVIALSQGVASLLKASGLQPGDRVAIIADNSPFWIQSYFGALLANGVAVPIAPAVTPAQLPSLLDWLSCGFVFVRSQNIAAFLTQVCHQTIFVEDSSVPERASNLSSSGHCQTNTTFAKLPAEVRMQLAVLMLTSGSVSDPKAVMISHKNIVANTISIIKALQLEASHRVLCLMPLSYCFSTSLLHTHFRVGGTVVLYPGSFTPGKTLRLIGATECTTLAGTPSVFQALLRTHGFAAYPTPSLRFIQQAGGRLAPAFVQALHEAVPDARIHIMYGQTEATARLTVLPAERISDKPDSVGIPIPGVAMEVLGQDGLPRPDRQTGEITASGENVALGYWRDEAATATRFRNGRLFTGDIGFRDDEGFYYIVDREEDFIKAAGHRFSASLVEDCILQIPNVVEVAVVAVPHRTLAEASKAYIVVKPGTELTHNTVAKHCRKALPHYMAPRQTVIVAELPKNANGKVLKSILRRLE